MEDLIEGIRGVSLEDTMEGHPDVQPTAPGAPATTRPKYSSKIPEPPLFHGSLEHTKLWIQQMKWHFSALSVQYAGHEAGLALSVAVTCLRGNAARWFQRLCATGQTPTDFGDLCHALERQFGVIDE